MNQNTNKQVTVDGDLYGHATPAGNLERVLREYPAAERATVRPAQPASTDDTDARAEELNRQFQAFADYELWQMTREAM